MEQERTAVEALPPAERKLPYPKPVTIQLQDGTQLPAEISLVAFLDAPVTVVRGGEEVPTGDVHYRVAEAVLVDNEVVQFLRIVGSGVMNPHVSH